MAITKEMIVGDVIDQYPDTAQVFMQYGMRCVNCPSARGERIECACAVHGMDADGLIEALNRQISE